MFCHRCTKRIPTRTGYCSQDHADADRAALRADINRVASCRTLDWAPWVDVQWRQEIRRYLALWDAAQEAKTE